MITTGRNQITTKSVVPMSCRTGGFSLEKNMVRVVQRKFPHEVVPPSSQLLGRFKELRVGMIAPDLVLVAARRGFKANETRKNPSFFECSVLAEIMIQRRANHADISEALFARTSNVQRAIVQLCKQRYITECKGGGYRILPNVVPDSIKVISIEAKLEKWRQAIDQAESYLAFSDKSFIALPQKVIEGNPKIRSECVARGIGLMSVDRSSVQIRVPAKSNNPISADRLWVIGQTFVQDNQRSW